jgi:hypothetical protein
MALASRAGSPLHVEGEKSDRALAGQPSPRTQSAGLAHARSASGACLGVVTARSPERRRERRWPAGGLGAPESVVQASVKYGERAGQPYEGGSSPGRRRVERAVEMTQRDVFCGGDDSAVADDDAWVVRQS